VTVTLEFVGGPLDGERRDFAYCPNEWRVPLPMPMPISMVGEYQPPPFSPPTRIGVYRFATFRKGERVGGRVYLVDTDVLRWDGE
jgi:hypothetical protein